MPEVFITAPLVDAYRRFESLSFHDFTAKMAAHADEWGEASLGRFVLRGLTPPEYQEGVYVMAVGTHQGRQYAAVGDKDGKIKVVEYDWPWEWDVT